MNIDIKLRIKYKQDGRKIMEYKNEKLEEFENYLKQRKVAIIGLGVSNLPLINYLHEKGAIVTVFDTREIQEIP